MHLICIDRVLSESVCTSAITIALASLIGSENFNSSMWKFAQICESMQTYALITLKVWKRRQNIMLP